MFTKRLIFSILGVVAVIIITVLVVRWQHNRRTASTGAQNSAQATLQAAVAEQAARVKALQQAATTDHDLDGLSDADEKKYGTDPNKADTDGDGLLDRDEIFIYHTNPLKKDTYGLGMTDGMAVRRGLILPGGKTIFKIKK